MLMSTPQLRLAELVSTYSQRLHPFVAAADNTVVSPLGMWLLLASVAPVASGDLATRLEDILGCSCDEAVALSKAFDVDLQPGVRSAIALWSNELQGELAESWGKQLPPSAQLGPIPTQADADAWAREKTDGLITTFPVTIDSLTRLLLASAVATVGKWAVEYDQIAAKYATRETSPWHEATHKFLSTTKSGASHVVRLMSGELVGVHRNITTNGTVVFSVVGASDVTEGLGQAHQILDAARSGQLSEMIVDPWLLPVGEGLAWNVDERTMKSSRPDNRLDLRCYLPEWSVRASHDLMIDQATGMASAGAIVIDVLGSSPEGDDVVAVQDVTATYSATGFSAAAITVLAIEARGMPKEPDNEILCRSVRQYFDKPYAVVACTGEDQGCVPLFDAWVSAPTTVTP
jgi:hypothetical protein